MYRLYKKSGIAVQSTDTFTFSHSMPYPETETRDPLEEAFFLPNLGNVPNLHITRTEES